MDYIISESTEEENEIIWKGILAYNSENPKVKSIKQGNNMINRVLKNQENNIIGGIKTVLSYHFSTLYVDLLWIDKDYRRKGYGSILMEFVEKIAIEQKCTIVYLETDFRAKDFYIKNGYEIFGRLDDVPPGYVRYYMKKSLST